ncbi:MAG: alpha/beta fold hydrolase [Deltaproteobacteria bacterium]|nr:alpha/beta fold hydrolase [Deltaproteobacteria bacterium]
MKRLRGLKALVHDAIDVTTHLVREGHESTSRAVMRVTDRIEPLAAPARGVDQVRRVSTDAVLGTIRLVNRGVEVVTDLGIDLAERARERRAIDDAVEAALEPAVPMRSDVLDTGAWIGDAAIALVNAAVGDHLGKRDNGLDLGMSARIGDHYVDLRSDQAKAAITTALARVGQAPSSRVVVFVHGLGTTEWSWCLEAAAYHGDPTATFASMLHRDLGTTAVLVRYNTGRHVSENGRGLASLLSDLVAAYPTPIEELVLVGHSMGGLVLRSACHYGQKADAPWLAHVRRVFCIGSPHGGAPLEKFGNVLTGVLGAIDLPGTLVPARILEGRSAGIKDLRHGALLDEDWMGRDPDALLDEGRADVPLLPNVAYHFVAATLTRDPAHPLGRMIGDLLVRVPSAQRHGTPGRASQDAVREETFEIDTQHFGGVLHHQMQNHPAIYAVLRDALRPRATVDHAVVDPAVVDPRD